MSDKFLITEMTVQAILARWPLTAKVFNRYSSVCIGCAIAPYCTIADVARLYHLPLDLFANDLKKAIEESDASA
jgi:hybrid cluster-associated redox disulfide protein